MQRHLQLEMVKRSCAIPSCRSLMTLTVDVPLDSDIRERPCMVVSADDRSFYDGASWQRTFRRRFPENYGIQFRCMELRKFTSLTAGLDEMKEDLASEMNVVLISKGPLISWLALYYLESLPLSGLVMVDPVEITQTSACDLKSVYRHDAIQQQLLDRIRLGAEDRPLLLEPGVLPIMVLSTRLDCIHDSFRIAARHSDPDGPFGPVTVTEVEGKSDSEVASIINLWIDEKVL